MGNEADNLCLPTVDKVGRLIENGSIAIKDGIIVDPNADSRISIFHDDKYQQLVIEHAKLSDSGHYECRTADTTCSAFLKILPEPVVLTKEFEFSDDLSLKLTGSVRYDKSEFFDGFGALWDSPCAVVVWLYGYYVVVCEV